MMAGEATLEEGGTGPAHSPLVEVTFQKNPQRKQKYLEAEPQALGITQIGLSVFEISHVSMFWMPFHGGDISSIVASLLVIIAGSVAIAAQSLHVPTLKACLGMQVVACVASGVNMFMSVIKMADHPIHYSCWGLDNEENITSSWTPLQVCQQAENTLSHLFAESLLIQAALIAISITLVAYCCKVVNCCSPPPKMPVITVQAPPTVQVPPVQQ